MCMKGKNLPRKYAVMLEEPKEDEAVYCCVKGFVRDTCLLQPPVYLSPPGRHTAIRESQPGQLIGKKEMSESEIQSYIKLAQLCKTKFDMPEAADALHKFVRERHYESVQFQFLAHPHRARYGVVREQPAGTNVHFPFLPDTTWHMCARVA